MASKSALSLTVKAVIRQRKAIIKMGKSFRNELKCLGIIKNLSMQIEAYEKRWDEEGWKSFVIRNHESIMYLIPENKAGETLKMKINESL